MADWAKILESASAVVITGGFSALTTYGATFKNIRDRLASLETKVGSAASSPAPSTGIFQSIDHLTLALTKIQRDIASWEEDPPAWLTKVVNRASRSTSMTLEIQQELEERVVSRIRSMQERLDRLEEKFREDDRYVSRDDYEDEARARAAEIASLKENLAAVNGLLRGIMLTTHLMDDKS